MPVNREPLLLSRRCRTDHFHNRPFQPLDSFVHVLDFVPIIEQGGFLRRMLKADLLEHSA
jgi:hypothetical protein